METWKIRKKAIVKAWDMINYSKAIRGRYGELFLPVEVEGHIIYVKLSLTCMDWFEGKNTKPFDPFAINEYNEAVLDKRIAEANRKIRLRKEYPELYIN